MEFISCVFVLLVSSEVMQIFILDDKELLIRALFTWWHTQSLWAYLLQPFWAVKHIFLGHPVEFLEPFYAERIGLPAVDFLMRPFCNICASLITCLFQSAQSLFKVHFPISLASTTIVDTRPVTKVYLFPSFKALIVIGQNDIVYGAFF